MSRRLSELDSFQPGMTKPISTSNIKTSTTKTTSTLQQSNLNLNYSQSSLPLQQQQSISTIPSPSYSTSERRLINSNLGYSELHLAPATRTSVVTTTTTTTVSFAPILIPKTTSIKPTSIDLQQLQQAQHSSRSNYPSTSKNPFLDLVDREGEDGNLKFLELDPKLYPLSQSSWPESMKRFKLPLGDLEGTFIDSNRNDNDIEEEEDNDREELVETSKGKGKGKEREMMYEDNNNNINSTTLPINRSDRGSTAQRRKNRRARSIVPSNTTGGGTITEDEEDDLIEMDSIGGIDLIGPNGARLPSPAQQPPPRKRPRAGSNQSIESEVGLNNNNNSNNSNNLRSESIPSNYVQGSIITSGGTVGLPSPNLSPPSPVPTFAGEESQECRDEEDLDLNNNNNSNNNNNGRELGLEDPTFNFGSGQAISGLLSLPDFVNTFDQLPPSLQTYFIFNFLKRSPIPVLQAINNIIAPSLRRDFLADLPPELSVHVLGYLDGKGLCRAAAVCKGWRRLVDGEWRVWKERLVSDELWIGDGSEEREAKEISGGNKENLFLKRWKAGLWDDNFHSTSKSNDVVMNVDEENISTSRRLSHPGKLASPSSSRENSPKLQPQPQPQPQLQTQTHFVHPFKILYRRRFITRRNWAEREPKRVNFACHANNVVTCLQFDKHKIVSASDDHSINVFDTRTGATKARLNGHEGGVWALQYIGNILVSGSTDRTVRIWDLDTGKCTHVFVGHTSTVRCLQIVQPENINPDLNGEPIWEPPYPIIVTGSRDWTLRVWRLPSPGKDHEYHPNVPQSPTEENTDPTDNPFHLRQLSGHRHAVRALAAHGRTLVSGSYDCQVRVWDLLTGECRHRLTGHQQKVYSVVFDPIRKQCASGSMDGTVRLWSTETGECKATLEGHSSLVGLLGLSFKNLVSAAADTTLRIWDPATGNLRHVLAAHSGAITCFQHDESKIISGSDGTLKMWDVRDGSFTRDLLTGLTGVWQVSFNQRFCVAAVQRNAQSEFDILDFGPIDSNEEDEDDNNEVEEEEGGKSLNYLEELVPTNTSNRIGNNRGTEEEDDDEPQGGNGNEGGENMDDTNLPLDNSNTLEDFSPVPQVIVVNNRSSTSRVPPIASGSGSATRSTSTSRLNLPRSGTTRTSQTNLNNNNNNSRNNSRTSSIERNINSNSNSTNPPPPTASSSYHARIAASAPPINTRSNSRELSKRNSSSNLINSTTTTIRNLEERSSSIGTTTSSSNSSSRRRRNEMMDHFERDQLEQELELERLHEQEQEDPFAAPRILQEAVMERIPNDHDHDDSEEEEGRFDVELQDEEMNGMEDDEDDEDDEDE